MNLKLSKLRQLHLVHADIKPDNILYSPGWRNIVLVDYGLATFVKETVQEETETYFMGTPHFVGKEMEELRSSKKSGFVNLYKNDYQMLLKTAQELFYPKPTNFLRNTPRTKDGYFIYKFVEIHNKFVKGKTSYRHIDPSEC